MNPIHLSVLKIIASNDGRFNWYQIDRALSHQGIVDAGWSAPGGLMPVLRELEQSQYVTATEGPNPSQPLYSLTPLGHRQLGAQPIGEARKNPASGKPDVGSEESKESF